MLKQAKLGALQIARGLGITQYLQESSWRRERLLILCYHGISLEDEHEWNSSMFFTPDNLRRRLQILKETDCNVLPLREAVDRLYSGTLPPRSVVITFDDGTYDFYARAWPILREFGYPVTLYLTTFYTEYNRPVFDIMCSYLLWKGRAQGTLDWPEVTGSPVLLDRDGQNRATDAIKAYAQSKRLSAREKDALMATLAEKVGIDYEEICRKRLLTLITPDEARQMVAEGLDIQLHTHRHRVYRNMAPFFRELNDNRQRISALTLADPQHFCYPGGYYLPEFPAILHAYGITSATTCQPGLCDKSRDPLLLPRLVDTMSLTELEFRSWISGVCSLLPHRRYEPATGQLLEEPENRTAPDEQSTIEASVVMQS